MTIDNLIDRSYYELFTKVCSADLSLYHLLTPYRTSDLLPPWSSFQLPDYYTNLVIFIKNSFIVRSLHEYIK